MKNLLIGVITLLASFSAWASPVNINTATAQEMAAAFYGVGLKRAEMIIVKREELGGFKEKREIMMVKGIGTKIFERIKEDIIVTTE